MRSLLYICSKAFDEYDTLPKTPEEEKLYAQVQKSYAITAKENTDFIAKVREMKALGISDEEYSRVASSLAISGEARRAFDNATADLDALAEYKMQHYGVERPQQAIAQAQFMVVLIIIVAVIAVVVAVLLGLIMARSITKPIVRIIDALSSGSNQIANSSNELAAVSEQIASGANEQAAGIEEVSSSMEELGSIVAHNVENTRASSDISMQAVEETNIGVEEMNQMVVAMDEIARATDEIKTVIDVIDDIAFQTNMLALNAAVEAARAGEAGLGFAVVADEVKNLANRSAESAKDTTAIIKLSLEKTEDGSRRAKKLAELFTGINTGGKKAFDMAKEVEAASKQQEEGINQINTAIMQLDQVVQQNAAASEEAASSAEELQSQVLLTEEIVEELTELVLGVQKRVQEEVHEEVHEEVAVQKTKPKEGSEKKYIEHI